MSPARSIALLVAASTFTLVVGLSPATAASLPPSLQAAGLVDSSVATTEGAALAIAQEFDHPVQVTDSLTPTTSVSALPDGHFKFESATAPVRVETDGGWVAVDSDLVRTESGLLTQKAATVPVEFSSGGSGPMVRVKSESGLWLSQVWPLGPLPEPQIDGNVATYLEVLPGVDLQLSAHDSGLRQVLIVESEEAASNPQLESLELDLQGVTLDADAGGNVEATLPDGSVLQASAPTWWDSSEPDAGAEGSAATELEQALEVNVQSSSLTLEIGASLEGEDVEYPIYVDPDWYSNGAADTHQWYVDSAYPTQNYKDDGPYTSDYERVGYISAAYSPDAKNHLTRAFYSMNTSGLNTPGIILRTSTATFDVREVGAFNCTASAVKLYRVTGASSNDTWNTATDVSWAQLQSTKTVAHGASGCPAAQVVFDATPAADYLQTHLASSMVFGLRASSETTNAGYKKFAKSAVFTVEYDNPPVLIGAGFSTGASECAPITSPTPISYASGLILQSSVRDPDKTSPLTTTFALSEVVSGVDVPVSGSPWTSVSISNGSTPSVPITNTYSLSPSAVPLPDGVYSLSATASDGRYGSEPIGPCYYEVDSVAPVGPDSISIESAAAHVGAPMTVRFVAGDDGTSTFAYWWAAGPASGTSSVVPAFGSVPTTPVVSARESADIVVAPVDTTSTLLVASYDPAGNVASSVVKLEVEVLPDPRVAYGPGHGWFIDQVPPSSTVLDLNSSPGSQTDNSAALTVGTSNYSTGLIYSGSPTPVFVSGSGSDTIRSARAVLDPNDSFTVGVFVQPPSSIPTTGQFTAISQAGVGGTATQFALGISNGKWQFCLRSLSATNESGCVTTSSPAPAPSQATYLSGTWDAVNQQLRLYAGSSQIAVASYSPSAVVTTPGLLYIASDFVGNVATKKWTGQALDPSVFPGVATVQQRQRLESFQDVNS